MKLFICQYCGSERKNANAKSNHEVYCKINPDRKIPKGSPGKRKKPYSVLEENKQEFTLCSYGCGKIAKYRNTSGNPMCENSHNKCQENKRKNSSKIKETYLTGARQDQKTQYKNLPEETKKKMAWAKGLTKETDQRIAKISESTKGKRKIKDKDRIEYLEYRERCAFILSRYEISKIKGYELLKEFGMYHKKKNINGVVRDHRISIWNGWINKIDPKIISHPANCEFITHKKNASKSIACSLDLETLLEEIEKWDCEGNGHTLLVEN